MNPRKQDPRSKREKEKDSFQRQVRRNQLIMVALSVVLVLSMVISLIRF